MTVADSRGNYPPAGTSLSVESEATDFTVAYFGGETVPAVGSAGNESHTFSFSYTDSDGTAADTADITVTYNGAKYVSTVTID